MATSVCLSDYIVNTEWMMSRCFVNTIFLLVGLLSAVVVFADGPASQYQGSAILDGSAAPIGAKISAWVPGTEAKTVVEVTQIGQYGPLALSADDDATPYKEGGVDGDLVRFSITIGDSVFNAMPISVWNSGILHTCHIEVLRNKAYPILSQIELNFGDVPLGSQKSSSFAVLNGGNAALQIYQIESEQSFFDILLDNPISLAKDSTVIISVLFQPEKEGLISDRIIVRSDAGDFILSAHAHGYELWPLHWRVQADTALWLGSEGHARSIAFNPMTHHLVLVGPGVMLLDAVDGKTTKELASPLQATSQVAISTDGRIFICNTAAAGSLFKLYQYVNEGSAPTLVFEGALDDRAGDALCVTGSGEQVRLYTSGLGNSKIYTFQTHDGISFSKDRDIMLPEPGAAAYSICAAPDADYFFIKGPSKPAQYINKEGVGVFRFNADDLPGANLSYFEAMSGEGVIRRFLASVNGSVPGTRVLELLGGSSERLCEQIFILPALTPTYSNRSNVNATAQVAYNSIDNTLVELSTNNGLSSYYMNQVLPDPMLTFGYLIGRVCDSLSMTPMPNAEVHIIGTEWITVTDDNGEFAFVDVPAGDYKVRVTAFNYFSQTQMLFVPANQVGVVNFQLQRRAYLPLSITPYPVGPDAHIKWTLRRPQTRLANHNDKPVSGWFQKMNKAYGVVFDLSGFSEATLEQMDFCHYAWQVLHGPYYYRVHIFNWQDSTQVAVIDGITSQDSYAAPQWEMAVDLGGITGLEKVGVFIEPLSGTMEDAHPVISTDDILPPRAGVNYIIEDIDNPFQSVVDTRTKNSGYGNFVIDLWINHNGLRRQLAGIKQPDVSVPAAMAGSTRGRYPITVGTKKPQPPSLQSLQRFNIYRNLADDPGMMMLLATVPSDAFSYVDVNAPQDSSYTYGVSAVYDSTESSVVLARYFHPPVLSIPQAKEDDNHDGLPDRIGQIVTVNGVITTPNFGSRSSSDFYIQDDHAGLKISSKDHLFLVEPGEQVYVSGPIAAYGDVTAITAFKPESVQILRKGVALPEPTVATVPLSKAVESMLVKLVGYTLIHPAAWPAEGDDAMVKITNGPDTVSVYIDKSTDMDGSPAPIGFFTLIGIVDQTIESDPAIRPRWLRDFIKTVGVSQEPAALPDHYLLKQNYPNPFNPTTTIAISMPISEPVRLSILDVLGKEVALVFSGKLSAGVHQFTFTGNGLSSGLYFYQLETPSFRDFKKMVLIK
jgi:hypothetical protein